MQPRMGLETFEMQIPTLPPAVLINDPANLEFVLKDIDLFVKGAFFQSNSWDLFGRSCHQAGLWLVTRCEAMGS